MVQAPVELEFRGRILKVLPRLVLERLYPADSISCSPIHHWPKTHGFWPQENMLLTSVYAFVEDGSKGPLSLLFVVPRSVRDCVPVQMAPQQRARMRTCLLHLGW